MLVNRQEQQYRPPNIDAIFSLIPRNDNAKAAVCDKSNSHLVSMSPTHNVASFDIGFHIKTQSSINTLATLGREHCDIVLRPNFIASTQCSFEMDDFNTGIIMFYDRSHLQTSQVSGAKSQPLERGRSPRKVLVCHKFNDKISMGDVDEGSMEFDIEWLLGEEQIKVAARKHWNAEKSSIANPRKARTDDPAAKARSSRRLTPSEAFQHSGSPELRYFKKGFLGSGTFGHVSRVIDVDSGRFMAMKVIGKTTNSTAKVQDNYRKLRNEVELMRLAKHQHIADLITSQGWSEGSFCIRIFMGLEEGNIEELSFEGSFNITSAERCLRQMLSALDFFACSSIVHRDVKPENILWSRPIEEPWYHFRLADFGVGNFERKAYSCQGTDWFMAPEILKLKTRSDADTYTREQQTPAVDVWSLFVTIAYALNVCKYRTRDLNTDEKILSAVRDACKSGWMSKFSSMAIEDPAHRASAFSVLNQHFEGVGVAEERAPIIDIEMSEDNVVIVSAEQQAQSTPSTRGSARSASRPSRIEKRRNTRSQSRASRHQMAAVAEEVEVPQIPFRTGRQQFS